MKQLTKEQYEALLPFSETLNEAKGGSYRAFLLSDAVKLNQIYYELTGDSQNVTCGRCLLMMLKTLAQAKDEYIETEIALQEQDTTVSTVSTVSTNSAKTKRKKK